MMFSTHTRILAAAFSLCTLAAHAQTTPAPTAVPVLAAPATAPVITTSIEATTAPLLTPAQVPGKYRDYLNKRYAADKEARAAVHMFGRKQTGGALWLLGGGALVGYAASQAGTTSSGTGTRTVTITPLGYLIFGGLPAGIAIGKFSRFGKGELYKMLQEYDKTHVLPGYVVTKLGKSDYQ